MMGWVWARSLPLEVEGRMIKIVRRICVVAEGRCTGRAGVNSHFFLRYRALCMKEVLAFNTLEWFGSACKFISA